METGIIFGLETRLQIVIPVVCQLRRNTIVQLQKRKKMNINFRNILVIPVLAFMSTGVFANRSILIYDHKNGPLSGDTSLKQASLIEADFSAGTGQHGNLLGFNAAYGKNSFDLNWNTLPQSDCDHFEIERSLDGSSFEKLGEIKGYSNQGQEETYSFRDKVRPALAIKNDFYYRLKQVDASGHVSYSKVLIARMYHAHGLSSLSITPDPVINDILVNVQVKEKSLVVMKIKDQQGNEIMRKTASAATGFSTHSIDGTHELKSGMYILEVIVNSSERLEMKLMKG